MIIGDKKAVSMVTDDPYVGEHTPRIDLPGDGTPAGLLQERLGLLDGKQYTGRIVLAGDPQAAPIEVSLVWGIGASDRDTVVIDKIGTAYSKFPLQFTSQGSTDNGRIEIVSRGKGHFLIGTVSLMPADNILGWRADTVALLKQLNSPVYRWPGGNFVSGYDWKDGIGDPDRRPPRKNPAWKGIEHNDVGIHEFLDLCREINAEAFIAVNTGLGGAEAAAEEIEYVNGGADTPMGKLRTRNGHSQPWGVKWWAIGNEMYGDWQLGHMPLEEYVKKHNRVVDAMRAVDPTFMPIAVGAKGRWSEQMLTTCADHMSLISEHLYCQDKDDVVSHTGQIAAVIRDVAECTPRIPQDHRVAGRQRHPHCDGRMELLVRSERIWRAGHALLPPGRPGHCDRPARILPQQRHLFHGQLRADRQRDRRDQDDEDGSRIRDDRTRAEAVPRAIRRDTGSGRRRSPAA